jgi:hypothetical protein
MHDDDESLERFLVENKPTPAAPPDEELRNLSARLGKAMPLGMRLFHRRRGTGLAAVLLSIAVALLVILTRQTKPHHAVAPAADIEAVLTDSYATLEDVGDDEAEDGSGLTWFEPSVAH